MRPQVDNHYTLAFPRRRLLCGPLHRKNVVVNRDFDKIKQSLLFWRRLCCSGGQFDDGLRAWP